ncbi:MAG: Tetratricopeptide repeat-containing protein [Chitinophagaceae bacterium]|nr:Tetratricopeptide repeat-containing protein [Chitinophagaceae bacterium]
MKYFFLLSYCLILTLQISAQGYMDIDSARKLTWSGKTSEERFSGMRSLDRFYYTTGKFDSSALLQKEMFAIAKESKRDSMMALVYRAIGNRYVTKTDYNFSIVNYARGLDYTTRDKQRRAGLYLNIAYVYIVTGNIQVALDYIQKGKAIGQTGQNLYFENLLYGLIYNDLEKPDSALFYFRQAENLPTKITDPLLISVGLLQMGRAYELQGDADLAETYYKKTMAYCKEKYLPLSIIRTGNVYCNFLMKNGKYDEAKQIALQDLDVAKKAGINEGIANVAEVLRKIYTHTAWKDSIIYYAQLQIDYKDSVSNQKKQSEFQNLTFSQQLHEIDEQTKAKEAAEEQRQNIQFALMALGIISFIIIFLLLSRSFITNTKMIEFLGVIALLIVFEFLNLLLHPFLERVTHHSPLLMLLALVCIAALLVPLHHKAEKWATAKLVEKNKQIRLAAAKKTIQQLDTKPDNKSD